ncbi:replication initiator 1-like isoform X1 [Gopherus flavomarginatus]|uniref:replication initiator 1-like isoform X1 n=2 Tax=Gopherus flavomarginatus TaxID=286002 RepID=UPI0021CC4D92|nr:replication initiator 1-like isoform X1 [Gopherus flavomarginatus]
MRRTLHRRTSRPSFTASTRRRRIDSGEASREQSCDVRVPSSQRMRNTLRPGRRRQWAARACAKTHVGGAAGATPPASLSLSLRNSVLPRRPDGTGSGPEEPADRRGMMSETHKHTDVGGSEDVIFEEEDGTSTGVSTVQEEEDESEATSVSSGESRPSTPSANGYPGPRSKELRSAVSEPQQEVAAEEGDAGQGRLGSPQAPSPEWHECPECGRGFGTSRALKVHRSYHVGRKRPHTSSSKPPPSRPAPPSAGDPEGRDARPVPPSPRAGAFHYICAECGLGFASPASLEAHRCEHGWRRSPPAPPRNKGPPAPPREANGARDAEGADGPYHCTECPGEFGLVADLHEHYMLHARGEL